MILLVFVLLAQSVESVTEVSTATTTSATETLTLNTTTTAGIVTSNFSTSTTAYSNTSASTTSLSTTTTVPPTTTPVCLDSTTCSGHGVCHPNGTSICLCNLSYFGSNCATFVAPVSSVTRPVLAGVATDVFLPDVPIQGFQIADGALLITTNVTVAKYDASLFPSPPNNWSNAGSVIVLSPQNTTLAKASKLTVSYSALSSQINDTFALMKLDVLTQSWISTPICTNVGCVSSSGGCLLNCNISSLASFIVVRRPYAACAADYTCSGRGECRNQNAEDSFCLCAINYIGSSCSQFIPTRLSASVNFVPQADFVQAMTELATTVVIPPWAVSAQVDVSVGTYPTTSGLYPDPPTNSTFIGKVREFTPTGYQFLVPVSLTFTENIAASASAVVSPSVVSIHKYSREQGAWVALPSVVNAAQTSITTQISSLETFALIRTPQSVTQFCTASTCGAQGTCVQPANVCVCSPDYFGSGCSHQVLPTSTANIRVSPGLQKTLTLSEVSVTFSETSVNETVDVQVRVFDGALYSAPKDTYSSLISGYVVELRPWSYATLSPFTIVMPQIDTRAGQKSDIYIFNRGTGVWVQLDSTSDSQTALGPNTPAVSASSQSFGIFAVISRIPRSCNSNTCSGHGQCNSIQECSCDSTYFGTLCSKQILPDSQRTFTLTVPPATPLGTFGFSITVPGPAISRSLLLQVAVYDPMYFPGFSSTNITAIGSVFVLYPQLLNLLVPATITMTYSQSSLTRSNDIVKIRRLAPGSSTWEVLDMEGSSAATTNDTTVTATSDFFAAFILTKEPFSPSPPCVAAKTCKGFGTCDPISNICICNKNRFGFDCSITSYPTASVSQVVPANKTAILAFPDYRASIFIAQSYISFNLTADSYPASLLPKPNFHQNATVISQIIEFGPKGKTFPEPCFIQITVGNVPMKNMNDSFAIFFYNTSKPGWDRVGPAVTFNDTREITANGTTTHFSMFALVSIPYNPIVIVDTRRYAVALISQNLAAGIIAGIVLIVILIVALLVWVGVRRAKLHKERLLAAKRFALASSFTSETGYLSTMRGIVESVGIIGYGPIVEPQYTRDEEEGEIEMEMGGGGGAGAGVPTMTMDEVEEEEEEYPRRRQTSRDKSESEETSEEEIVENEDDDWKRDRARAVRDRDFDRRGERDFEPARDSDREYERGRGGRDYRQTHERYDRDEGFVSRSYRDREPDYESGGRSFGRPLNTSTHAGRRYESDSGYPDSDRRRQSDYRYD